ncbi:hypothetical protein D3C76_334180 [compost metagenome]
MHIRYIRSTRPAVADFSTGSLKWLVAYKVLIAYDAVGNNLMSTATVSVSSNLTLETPGTDPSLIFSEPPKSNALVYVSGNGSDGVLTVDLGSLVDVSKIKVLHMDNLKASTKLETSVDGITWDWIQWSQVEGTITENPLGDVYVIPMNRAMVRVVSSVRDEMSYGLADDVLKPDKILRKAFSLNNNKLDGSSHPIQPGQYGWWSNRPTDATGTIITGALGPNPYIQVLQRRDIWALSLVFDALLQEWPTRIEVQAYKNNQMVFIKTINPTGPYYYEDLGQTYSVDAVKYIIYSVNRPFASPKITELTQAALRVRQTPLKLGIVAAPAKFLDAHRFTDSLKLKAPVERQVTNIITRRVILRMKTEPTKELDNIYIAMMKDTRQVYGKVEIAYTDPYNDTTLKIESSESNPNTPREQLADGITRTKYKGFALHRNDLSGSFHPLPTQLPFNDPPGWWGYQLSDNEGRMPTPVTVSVSFSPRLLTTLQVSGDTALQEFPVDFDYRIYVDNSIVKVFEVRNNTEVSWFSDIDDIARVSKIELVVYRINMPGVVVKLTELFTAFKETYYNEQIESIRILDEVGYTTGQLPIGNISANEVDITIMNEDRRFDLTNTDSPLYGYIKRNRKVKVWLGAIIGEDQENILEWVEMGTYWTTSWDIASANLTASLVARDRLDQLTQTEFWSSKVYVNQSLHALFTLILADAGLISSEYEIDNSLHSIIIPYAWFDKMTHRDALAHLASCAVIQIFTTKKGVIRVNLDLDATPTVIALYDDDSNVYSAQYPMAVGEQVNSISVSYAPYAVGTEVDVLTYNSSIVLKAGESYSVDLMFDTSPVMDVTSVNMDGATGITLQSYEAYAWGVRAVFKNNTTEDHALTGIIFRGHKLEAKDTQTIVAEDKQSILDNGKLTSKLEHPFIQTSDFASLLASTILTTYKDARYDITMSDRGHAAIRMADKIVVNNLQRDAEYMVTRASFTWDGALSANTSGKLLRILDTQPAESVIKDNTALTLTEQ